MTVTQVFTNLTEYSRYFKGTTPDRPDLSVIIATIVVTNPVAGEILSVALCRMDGYGAVCTKTLTLANNVTTYTVKFDLNVDGYQLYSSGILTEGVLPAASTSDSIYRAKQGDYTIQVTDPLSIVTDSPQFAVSIVPLWELRNVWLKGITFYDYEKLLPRIQPQVITGVTITEVSENHFKGPFTLTFVASTSSLSWGTGPSVPVIGQAPTQMLLTNNEGDAADFIMVSVTPLSLPTTNLTETLYIDNARLSDTAMIDHVRRATSAIQQEIICKVEPSIVDTDPSLNGYADEQALPETYYRPSTYNKWMSFRIPYPRILWPGDLTVTGCFGFTQTAVVPRMWMNWSEMSGQVELVPSSSAQVIWSFYNSIFVMAYLFNYPSVPGFWHYRATVGLRDLFNERAVVREAIAKKASSELLTTQGTAYRGGHVSHSSSRDGINQSQTYIAGEGGIYGPQIAKYDQWLEEKLPKIKKRFMGISYVTI